VKINLFFNNAARLQEVICSMQVNSLQIFAKYGDFYSGYRGFVMYIKNLKTGGKRR